MKLIFISDLHLSEQTHNNNQLFYSLMAKWQSEIDALYILGDFFDFWCGDDDDNAFIREIKHCLKQFTRSKPIYYLWGNHDFGIGKVFANDTGITLIKDCTMLKVGKHNILLSHGDVFCTLDTSHQRLKLILQNPVVKWILRQTPLSWRYKIKDRLEHKSAKTFNSKPRETYHVVDNTIARIAHKYNADIVIHGHTHNPDCYKVNAKHGIILRFEIPDWVDRSPGGYVLFEDDIIKIHIP